MRTGLGTYTVQETVAPPGFAPDPDTITVNLTLGAPDATIGTAFENPRAIVKLTEFGYTNAPTGTPTAGVVSGTTTYTVRFKNFGGATATLTGTLAVTVTGAGGGTLEKVDGTTIACTPTCTVNITPGGVSLAPNAESTATVTVRYTDLADGAVITADLNATYETNSPFRSLQTRRRPLDEWPPPLSDRRDQRPCQGVPVSMPSATDRHRLPLDALASWAIWPAPYAVKVPQKLPSASACPLAHHVMSYLAPTVTQVPGLRPETHASYWLPTVTWATGVSELEKLRVTRPPFPSPLAASAELAASPD